LFDLLVVVPGRWRSGRAEEMPEQPDGEVFGCALVEDLAGDVRGCVLVQASAAARSVKKFR
jgi:hypothetical protein